ncbi:MAG: metal-dependent transcriptional regulator [Mycobacteriales bacterium]
MSRASESIEDYVKTIFKLTEHPTGAVTTTALSRRLGISAASTSGMLRRLQEMGLVSHEPYRDIQLTPQGRRLALGVLRRHRLIELYLVKALGYTWDEVHDEAEVLEHAVSERLLERIAASLDQPRRDPHGDPIPTADGELAASSHTQLAALPDGAVGRISRVSDDDPELLRYLTEQRIGLDDRIEVLSRVPFGGPLVVRVGAPPRDVEHALGEAVTAAVYVTTSE